MNTRLFFKSLTIYTLMLLSVQIKSQSIIAYTDNRGYFNIFDNGVTTVADYQVPQSFQIGGNCVAYVDFNNSLKVYYKGEISTLYDGIPTKYQVTHNLVIFNVGGVIKVFDKGVITTISGYAASFQVGDSLVAFVDQGTASFQVYYNGKFQTMEDFHVTQNILGYNASNNTMGYLTYLNEFKVFWQGNGYNIFKLPNASYKLDYQTGSNIISFTTNGFGLNAFYKGNTYPLSNKQITNYQTGDDMVAYNDAGGFHVFYAGKNYDLNGFAPDFYLVADSMLIYYTPGFFYCFNKGKKEILENFMPSEYSIDNNTLTYVDLQGGLKAYYNDDTYQLSTFDRIIGFKLVGNAVWFSTATVYNQVFLKGKTY